jgi:shikimate kinase
MDYLNQQGQTVYLKAAPEVLYSHLLMGKVERPLIKGKSPEELITFIRQQLDKREPYYSKAKYTLDVSLMDNYEKIKISVDKIKEILGI